MKYISLVVLTYFLFGCAEKKYKLRCENVANYELLTGSLNKKNVCGNYKFYNCNEYLKTSEIKASRMVLHCDDSTAIRIYNFPKVFVEYDLTKEVIDTLFSFYTYEQGFKFNNEFYPTIDFFNYKKYNPSIVKGANASKRFNIIKIEMDTMLLMYDVNCNYIIYKKE